MEELSRSFFLVGEICLFSDTPDVALTWANLLVRVLHIFGEKVFTNKQSLLDRSKELLEKKQLDHTRGAGVIFWSHLFDLGYLTFVDKDVHTFVNLYDSCEEIILEPLLTEFGPLVLDKLDNKTTANILMDHVIESLLATNSNVKSLCLDYLIPRMNQLNDIQIVRLLSICCDFQPDQKTAQWLYSKWKPLLLAALTTKLNLSESCKQKFIANTKILSVSTNPQLQSQFIQTAADFLASGQGFLFCSTFGEELDNLLNRAEYDPSIQPAICKRAADLSNKSLEENMVQRVLRYLQNQNSAADLVAELDDEAVRQIRAVFVPSRVSKKDVKTRICECLMLVNCWKNLCQKKLLWRDQVRLIWLTENIICQDLFQECFFSEESSAQVDYHKEALHQLHSTVIEIFNRLAIPTTAVEVVNAISRMLTRLFMFCPTRETQLKYEQIFDSMSSNNCHFQRICYLRIFYASVRHLTLGQVKLHLLPNISKVFELDKGYAAANYFIENFELVFPLSLVDSEFRDQIANVVAMIRKKGPTNHFTKRIDQKMEALLAYETSNDRVANKLAEESRQNSLLQIFGRVRARKRELSAIPSASNLSDLEKKSSTSRSLNKKPPKNVPLSKQALENISAHLSLKSVSNGVIVLNRPKHRLVKQGSIMESQRILPNEESQSNVGNRSFGINQVQVFQKSISSSSPVHLPQKMNYHKHSMSKKLRTISRSFVRSLTNPSPTALEEKAMNFQPELVNEAILNHTFSGRANSNPGNIASKTNTSIVQSLVYSQILSLEPQQGLQPQELIEPFSPFNVTSSTQPSYQVSGVESLSRSTPPTLGGKATAISQMPSSGPTPPKPMFKVRTVSRVGGSKENIMPPGAIAARQSLLPKLVSTPNTKMVETKIAPKAKYCEILGQIKSQQAKTGKFL